MTRSEREVRVNINQDVDAQSGGQIIGAYFAAQEVKAPGPEVVAAYLERDLRPEQFPGSHRHHPAAVRVELRGELYGY